MQQHSANVDSLYKDFSKRVKVIKKKNIKLASNADKADGLELNGGIRISRSNSKNRQQSKILSLQSLESRNNESRVKEQHSYNLMNDLGNIINITEVGNEETKIK